MKPKLRFKNFNNEWEEIELRNIASEIAYGMNSASKEYYGENKYIRITDIDENSNRYSNKDVVSPDGILEDRFLVKENDILFARTGASTGKTYLYNSNDGKLYYAGFLIKASIINHNSNFIFQQTKLNKYNNWIKIMSMRSGQPGINSQEYGSYRFSITNIDEENKVSNFLSLIDKKIELQSKKIEDLKLFKMSTLDKYFNKDTCKEKALLKKYCSCLTGKSKADKVDINGNYYIMDMGTVNSDGNILKTKPTFCNLDLLSYGDLVMPKDDIGGGLIIGKTGFIDEDNKYVLGDHVYLLKVNDINSLFLHYQINSKYINKQLKRKVTGSAQLGLKSDNILNQEIYIYSEEEQKKIANIFKLIDRKIELETEKIFKLINLKKGLMQNMFV